MSILIYFILFYILLGFSMMKPFEKAGIDPKKALIPGVASIEWCKLIGRKPSYALLLLVPIVNIFIFCGMAVDLMRSFGKFGFVDAALAVIYAPLAFFKVGRDESASYNGPVLDQESQYFSELAEAKKSNNKAALRKLEGNNPYHKNALREWTEAIVFAVFAAAFIRMFLIEAYVIPTSSMEGTMKIGDFLFVSKAHYGIRTPMTVLQVPLVHNHLASKGILNRESYLENPKLPYYRLPAIESIDNNDPVVFNWPVGDSIFLTARRSWDIYQVRQMSEGLLQQELNTTKKNLPNYIKNNLITRPIDKRDHYIKRCLGIAGDSLEIRNNEVFINGKQLDAPEHRQLNYYLYPPFNLQKLDELNININEGRQTYSPDSVLVAQLALDSKQVERIKSWGVRVEPVQFEPMPELLQLFPQSHASDQWTVSDYGPIYIPKAGTTVKLDSKSLPFYERIIRVYEGNDLSTKGGKILINGQETDSYTFKQDYFWMMGDNRHNSEDSRFWGFVPHDHVVGKPLFIWFSLKNGNLKEGIRWDRIFNSAQAK